MKAAAVFVAVAAVGLVLALGVGMLARTAAPAPDTAEIIEGVGDIVETLADSDARFVREIYVWSTWSNGMYLTQALPYTFLGVAGAVLGLGLGMLIMGFAILGRRR